MILLLESLTNSCSEAMKSPISLIRPEIEFMSFLTGTVEGFFDEILSLAKTVFNESEIIKKIKFS